jgi:cation diffusion facilitator CzcD-associated flavoprotein CzcO
MQDVPTADASPDQRLAALREKVRADLEVIAHPRMEWLSPRQAPDGTKALDVLIVGAGQSGIATAFGLKRARVDNVLVVDRAERGREGPWLTYARMDTLRSPKDYTGPDLDIPSLTYRSWHAARFGEQSWRDLDLIRREDWAEYLLWVRDTVAIPVSNGVDVTAIRDAGDLIEVHATTADGRAEVWFTRKLVLATGQDGMGVWWMPPDIEALPKTVRAHAADDIDFDRLRGRTVAVVGAGASAFDNAATALEHGAREVLLFCRRETPQVIQPYRWLTFRGFLDHLADLDDAWRWRFMQHILGLREGFPQQTYDRCARHSNFRIVSGAPCRVRPGDQGGAVLETPKGTFEADFVIAGTGVDMDFARRPELAAFADNIATWADRYTPPDEEKDERLARYPYLSEDFALVEKVPGATPWIANIHVFSIASTMSFGPSGSSINAMTTCVPKLVSSITKGLFKADVEDHWAALKTYDVPQAILRDAGT